MHKAIKLDTSVKQMHKCRDVKQMFSAFGDLQFIVWQTEND